MKKFLKYELHAYLRGRSSERKKELPLILNENQPYIHYRKGSVVMYALQDYIGEDSLNNALRKYIDAVSFPGTSLYNFYGIPGLHSCSYPRFSAIHPGRYV